MRNDEHSLTFIDYGLWLMSNALIYVWVMWLEIYCYYKLDKNLIE